MINQDYKANSASRSNLKRFGKIATGLLPESRRMKISALAGMMLIIGGFSTLPQPHENTQLKLVKELPLSFPESDEQIVYESKDRLSDIESNIELPTLSQSMTVKSGDSLARLFSKADLDARDLFEVMQLKESDVLKSIHPGDKIAYSTNAVGKLSALSYVLDELSTLYVYHTENGYKSKIFTKPLDIRQGYGEAEITSSMYQAGKDAGLSDKLVMELVSIFQWDIDFILDIRKGDRFSVIFEEKFVNGEKIGLGNIVAATFTNQDKTFRAIRYTDTKGNASYYDPEGNSMRKAFLRAPLNFSRVSSNFNLRRKHPKLNRIRAHKGVDYAAATGTPVRASGDGKINFAGRKGGYGKVIILNHGQTYQSRYAHLSRYAKGIRSGSRVSQGQIIGYVGSTGLATGPHLHYEFLVNGVHRNPRTIALPNAKPIPEQELARFKQKTADLRAQLDVRERIRLAQIAAIN